MTRFLPALAALALLGACGPTLGTGPAPGPRTQGAPNPSEVAGAAIPPRSGFRTYVCADGRVVRQEDENDGQGTAGSAGGRAVLVEIDGRTVPMVQGVSASGVRYIGGGYQWWTRGLQTATLARLGPNESLASDPGVPCRSNG